MGGGFKNPLPWRHQSTTQRQRPHSQRLNWPGRSRFLATPLAFTLGTSP